MNVCFVYVAPLHYCIDIIHLSVFLGVHAMPPNVTSLPPSPGLLGHRAHQGLLWSMLARMGVFAASAVTWIHTPELFPTRVRATGHAVSNSSAQLGSFCAPFLITTGGAGLVGALLATLSAVAMVCVLLLPETSGTSLDLIGAAGEEGGEGRRDKREQVIGCSSPPVLSPLPHR
jgi:hypothetical protein